LPEPGHLLPAALSPGLFQLKLTEPAAFSYGAAAAASAQFRYCVVGQASGHVGEVVDEIGAVSVALEYVVVVDVLLDQSTRCDQRVDFGGGGVGFRNSGSPSISHTTRPSTSTSGFGLITCRSRTTAPGFHRSDRVVQDVHDVLGFYSSE
jgi:hypothetical protein